MLNFLAWKPGKKVIHIEEEAPYKEKTKEEKEEEVKTVCPPGDIECSIPSEIEL